VRSKPGFAPPLPGDGQQFFADGIKDELTGGDAFGFAVILDAIIQAFGDIRTDAFIPCGFVTLTHVASPSSAIGYASMALI
jgi:hypothetical protein